MGVKTMTNKDIGKSGEKIVELQDEQLDNVSGGGLKQKSSPDQFRDNKPKSSPDSFRAGTDEVPL